MFIGNIMVDVDPITNLKLVNLRCWGSKLKSKLEYFLYVYFYIYHTPGEDCKGGE